MVLIVQPFVESTAPRISKVLFFGPDSSRPLDTKALPFRFRVVDWNHGSSNNSTRSMIGITQSWNIVVCGDGSRGALGIEDIPREIDRTTGIVPRKTLFQDIFGASAFADTPTTISPAVASTPHLAAGDRQDFASLFDIPAYLAPPLETVYSTLIGSFLVKPSEHAEPQVSDDRDDSDGMDVDSKPRQVVRRPRIVEDKELDGLVERLRAHTLERKCSTIECGFLFVLSWVQDRAANTV